MITVARAIANQFRRAFLMSAAVAIAVFLGQGALEIANTNRQIERMVVSHSVALGRAAALSQDLLLIQKEVSRFVENLNQTQNYQVQVDVKVDGRLVASGGDNEGSLFESSVQKTTTLPSGNSLSVVVRVDHARRIFVSARSAFFFLGVGLIGILFLHRVIRLSLEALTRPLGELASWIHATAKGLPETLNASPPNISNPILEYGMVRESVKTLLAEINGLHRSLSEMQSARIKAEIAAQVSHDIRSPLAALVSIAHRSPGLDESDRVQLRTAANRIRDIANQLLEKNRHKGRESLSPVEKPSGFTPSTEEQRIELLSANIESTISQKRHQFADDPTVEVEAYLEQGYGLFASIQPTELTRVVSNLVNNAVEAFDGPGLVRVSLSEDHGRAIIEVRDNGKGMPAHVLRKIGNRGETHGKSGGSGLGVYHAKETIESWGGSFHIQSELGKGSCVRISLPKVSPPKWFVDSISIENPSTILILDDDESIHQIWASRFRQAVGESADITLLHFYSLAEILQWFRKTLGVVDHPIYLCDFELIGSRETGLDVIEMLGVAAKSVLVTSRYDEPAIQDQCAKFGVHLLPKTFAPFVPILVSGEEQGRVSVEIGLTKPSEM